MNSVAKKSPESRRKVAGKIHLPWGKTTLCGVRGRIAFNPLNWDLSTCETCLKFAKREPYKSDLERWSRSDAARELGDKP